MPTRQSGAVVPRATVDDLRALARSESRPSVSVYLTLEAAHPRNRQNAVRGRHAVEIVESRLTDAGAPDAAARVAALEDAIVTEVGRLAHPARTLAVFLDDAVARVRALETDSEDIVSVADRFVIRPLVRALHLQRRFLLLALSINRVELFEGNGGSLQRLDVAGLPSSLEAALGSDLTEPAVQYHSAGRGRAVFHGQGGAADARTTDIDRFHHVIMRALSEYVPANGRPLLLAADDQHEALRAMAAERYEVVERLAGSPFERTHDELRELARGLVAEVGERDRLAARASYERAHKTGKTAGSRIEDVALAAVQGRIHRLWTDRTASLAGAVREDDGGVATTRGDDDVLEALAGIVIGRGGEVWVVEPDEMPAPGPAVAELR